MSSGWRESKSSTPSFSSTISGACASMSTASCAIACTASSSPRIEASRAMSSARSPARQVSSLRMRTTSARSSSWSATMSLLSSTAGSGSTKKLAPEPELPWMIPGSWPLCSALSSST